MGLIGSTTPIAQRQKRIALFTEGTPEPDGEGGWITPEIPLDPPKVDGRVRPASQSDLERLTSGTVIATATHIVTIPFHPGVTTKTRLHVEDTPRPERAFNVVGVSNPEERDAELNLVCVEIVE